MLKKITKIGLVLLILLQLPVLLYTNLSFYNLYFTYSAKDLQQYYNGSDPIKIDYNPTFETNSIEGYALIKGYSNFVDIKKFNKPVFQQFEKAVLENFKNDWQAVPEDIVIFNDKNSSVVAKLQSHFPKTYKVIVATYPQFIRHRSIFVNTHPHFFYSDKYASGYRDVDKILPGQNIFFGNNPLLKDFYVYDLLHPDRFYLINNYQFDPYIASFRVIDNRPELFSRVWNTSLAQKWKDNNCFKDLNFVVEYICKTSYFGNPFFNDSQTNLIKYTYNYNNSDFGYSIKYPGAYKEYFADTNSKKGIYRVYKNKNVSLDTAIKDLVSFNGEYLEDSKGLVIGYEYNDYYVKMLGQIFPSYYQVAKIIKSSSSDFRLKDNFIIYDPNYNDRFFIFIKELLSYQELFGPDLLEVPHLKNGLPWYSTFKATAGTEKFGYLKKSTGIPEELKNFVVLPFSADFNLYSSSGLNDEGDRTYYTLHVKSKGDEKQGYDFNNINFTLSDKYWGGPKSILNSTDGLNSNLPQINNPYAIKEIKKLFFDTISYKNSSEKIACPNCLVSSNHSPDYLEEYNDKVLNYYAPKTSLTKLSWLNKDLTEWVFAEDKGNKISFYAFKYALNTQGIPDQLIWSQNVTINKLGNSSDSYYDYFKVVGGLPNDTLIITENYCNIDPKSCFINYSMYCKATSTFKNSVLVSEKKQLNDLCPINVQ